MSDLIINGHEIGSYFWIMPVKIKNIEKDTNDSNNIEELRKYEISIEENDVFTFLFYYLEKYFQDKSLANKNRSFVYPTKYSDGKTSNFSWNLDYNFYDFENIINMIKEIKTDVEKLKNNYFDSSLDELKNYLKNKYNDNIIDAPSPEIRRQIIEFYEEFITLINNMMSQSKQNYKLISFMGP